MLKSFRIGIITLLLLSFPSFQYAYTQQIKGSKQLVVVLDGQTSKPGKYFYEIVISPDGAITLTQLTNIVSIGVTTPPNPPPPPPPIPDNLSNKVKELVEEKVNDPIRKQTASRLAIGYRSVISLVNFEQITSVGELIQSQATINTGVLTASQKLELWKPFLDSLDELLDTLKNNGKLNNLDDYKLVWKDIAEGLDKVE